MWGSHIPNLSAGLRSAVSFTGCLLFGVSKGAAGRQQHNVGSGLVADGQGNSIDHFPLEIFLTLFITFFVCFFCAFSWTPLHTISSSLFVRMEKL